MDLLRQMDLHLHELLRLKEIYAHEINRLCEENFAILQLIDQLHKDKQQFMTNVQFLRQKYPVYAIIYPQRPARNENVEEPIPDEIGDQIPHGSDDKLEESRSLDENVVKLYPVESKLTQACSMPNLATY